MPRSGPPRLVAFVLLSFLAQALVPRATWYAHRHAGSDHEHVHAWDGALVAGSTASLRDFLPHEHRHDHGVAPDPAPARRGHAAHAAGHVHAHDAPAARTHGARSRRAAGPILVASHDGVHAHAQAPFQAAVATSVTHLAAPLPHRERAARVLAPLAIAAAHAPCARAPPASRPIRSPQFV